MSAPATHNDYESAAIPCVKQDNRVGRRDSLYYSR
jgi:hypothetical protein